MLGYHFHPTDEELLILLLRFLAGKYEGFIENKNIYGEEDPWKVFTDVDDKDSDKKVWYFFAPLQRKAAKNGNGKRFSRAVGKSGTWHGQDKGQKVSGHGHEDDQPPVLLGFKRRFLYKNGKEPEHNNGWLLQEFYLQEQVMKLLESKGNLFPERKDFVICGLKRRKRQTNVAWDYPRTSVIRNVNTADQEGDFIGNKEVNLQDSSSVISKISDDIMDECNDDVAMITTEGFQGVNRDDIALMEAFFNVADEDIPTLSSFSTAEELLDNWPCEILHQQQPQQQQQQQEQEEQQSLAVREEWDNVGGDVSYGNYDLENMDDQQWLSVLNFDCEPNEMTRITSC